MICLHRAAEFANVPLVGVSRSIRPGHRANLPSHKDEADMRPVLPDYYQLWLRISFVIIASGALYLGLQGADLWALHSLAGDEAHAATVQSAIGSAGALVTVTERPLAKVAEIGDGGDLGHRAMQRLQQCQPYLFARGKAGVASVALGPTLDYLGGELLWSQNDVTATVILPDALIRLAPGQTAATRNYRPLQLAAAPVAEYGQLWAPVKNLDHLCGVQVKPSVDGTIFTLTRGNRALNVIVRERMYSLEVSRSGRWLQVFFLGEPIKRYPLCTGRGENTPTGHFRIQNKAVWPPWTAYWGEYMPGGSARNPLGARWLGTTARGHDEGRIIGIHGTNDRSSIGQRISGGCMRTYNEYAVELYNNIPIGTPVYIHE